MIKKVYKDIKLLKIQGATAVARTIVTVLKKDALSSKETDFKKWRQKIRKDADYLLSARPTEPMAQNGVKFIFANLYKSNPKNILEAKNYFKKACNDYLTLMEDAASLIINQGQKVIKIKNNIFTHCHSWLVEQILVRAKKEGKNFKVFNTETRPLFQGHITAKKLLKAKIPVTMVVDSSSDFLISRYSGKNLMIDKVIIGADAILSDGSVINKIGSFGIALTAHEEKIPIYIAVSLLKFYPKNWIKIEKRPAKEIWMHAPKKLKIINFAFDRIPAEYITGIICEEGIIKPKNISNLTKKIYPWIT